jgi:polysaccharide deacetylase 2 family uncharacterized protein YibQ
MKKNIFFNPDSLKKRIRLAFIFLLIIISCLITILLFLPAKSEIESKLDLKKNYPNSSVLSADNTQKTNNLMKKIPLKRAKILIIIDDAGYNLPRLKRLLQFPGKLTVAVLPQLPLSKQSAELVHNAGKEVILHLPMQPAGLEDPGPGAITVNQDEKQIVNTLTLDMATVPHARGINNHMGSLATTDERVVDIILRFCKNNNLFFLDSKTTPHSLIESRAANDDLSVLARDLFLDNEKGKDFIKEELLKGMEIANKQGRAVLIGHLGEEMIEVLNEMYPLLIKQGYELATASELLMANEEK